MPGGSFYGDYTRKNISRKRGLVALTLHALSHKLADPAGRFGSFTCPALRRLFISTPVLHLAEHPFTLQLFFQDAQRLINIVISYGYVHGMSLPFCRCGCGAKVPRAPVTPKPDQGWVCSMMKAGL